MIKAILIGLAVVSLLSLVKTVIEVAANIQDARDRRSWREKYQQAVLYDSATVDGHRDGRQEAL